MAFARANKKRPGTTCENRRPLAAALILPLVAFGAGQQAHRGQPSVAAPSILASTPKCAVFHPVTNVASSVPVLGFGATSLGWGTAHPHAFSNGGEASGTVWCITWRNWGGASSYGRGSTEIYGPANSRPIVNIEIRAFDLGHCRSGGQLAYEHLDVKEPTRPGGVLGPWTPWGPTGRICPWPRPMPAGS
jgi:hypothetical protein